MTTESYWTGAPIEAADLLAAGMVKRVAVMGVPDRPLVQREFARRRLPFEDVPTHAISELQQLGVPSAYVDRIPVSGPAGTTNEGDAIVAWCARRGIRSVIVLTSPDHGRRFRRRMARARGMSGVHVIVRATHYGTFRPADWWTRRDDLRTGLVELQKLVLDVIAHPF